MNKGRRQEITKLKFKKRLKALGLKQSKPGDYTCFKHQAKPCSCAMCSPVDEKPKYKSLFKMSAKSLQKFLEQEEGSIF